MSITSYGPSTLPKEGNKLLARFQEKKINDISDIEGARSQPKYKHYFSDKPAFLPSDVEGSTSKPLTHTRNTRDNSLYIDDIEGTRFVIKDRMMKTNRHVNPLEPEYSLPSYATAEIPETKFIKDPLNNKDIEGAQVRPKRWYATRDIMAVNDIVGAQANWRPRHAKARLEGPPHEIMQVSDIAAKTHRYVDKTSRCSDTLNPHYFINGMEYKDESYTRPRPNRALIADNTILRTDDIPGAYVGWLAEKQPRRDFRNTNFIGDIKGAHADSIRPGIVTKREVNPLVPVYQSLDPGELVQPLNRPLVPAELVKVPTLPPKNKTSDPSAIGAARQYGLEVPQARNPYGQGDVTGRSRSTPTGATGGFNSSFGQTGGGFGSSFNGFSPAPSQRASPAASARGDATLTSAQRKMMSDKMDEINLVRQLRS
eukprot:gene31305-40677_t